MTKKNYTIPVSRPSITDLEVEAVDAALRDEQLSMGRRVEAFEERFTAYHDLRYGIAVSSGTAALHLALLALGVKPGHEVIVPALTFVATANAVTYCGATPVIVDVDPATWCIDPAAVEKAITTRTRAIIPVHLYGVCAPMYELKAIAEKHSLWIVEDAAEALGAVCGVQRVGSIGDIGCFSFYGNKTLATGEGGMVICDNRTIWQDLKLLRGQGQGDRRYWHEIVGYNYRMTELQGALGLAQLGRLPKMLAERAGIVKMYRNLLPELTWQETPENTTHGSWAAAALLPVYSNRQKIMDRLAERGIETRPVFYPLGELPMYSSEPTPAATAISKRGIVLPVYPGLSNVQQQFVAQELLDIVYD